MTGLDARHHPAAFDSVVATPFDGLRLGIRVRDQALAEVDFLLPGTASYREETAGVDGLARRVAEQLNCYWVDPNFQFDLPLAPRGSSFQHRVWAALEAIPAGGVRHYGQLAHRLGSSARAVGSACRANPIPIIVPCHRVVAVGGLGGYSGETAGSLHRLKSWLLAHEGYRGGGGYGDITASAG